MWVLSRYADVAAALRDPLLVPASPISTAPAATMDAAAHARFREEALRVLAASRMREWEAQASALAQRRVAALPADRPVDLVAEYAAPWSLEVAGIAAGVEPERRAELGRQARRIFEAACEPFDAALEVASRDATTKLALACEGSAIHVQMFIALSQSLPAFLGNAWLALIEHRSRAVRLPQAIDELLRLAGPARAIFRRAAGAVIIGGCTIRPQERVMLRLDRANRDPRHFTEPDELRFDRAPDHVAFGGGVHACVGGSLIRLAAAATTRAWIANFGLPEECTAATVDAFAMRYVSSLVTVLRK